MLKLHSKEQASMGNNSHVTDTNIRGVSQADLEPCSLRRQKIPRSHGELLPLLSSLLPPSLSLPLFHSLCSCGIAVYTHHWNCRRRYAVYAPAFPCRTQSLPGDLAIILTFCLRAIYRNRPLTVIPDSYPEPLNPKSVATTPAPLIYLSGEHRVCDPSPVSRWSSAERLFCLFPRLGAKSPILQVVLSTADSYQTPISSAPLQSASVLTKLEPLFHPQALSSLLLTNSVLDKSSLLSFSSQILHVMNTLDSTVWESPRPFSAGNLDD